MESDAGNASYEGLRALPHFNPSPRIQERINTEFSKSTEFTEKKHGFLPLPLRGFCALGVLRVKCFFS
jgi:hypothetical protein